MTDYPICAMPVRGAICQRRLNHLGACQKMPRRRDGRCPLCRQIVATRADGGIYPHHGYRPEPCKGAGRLSADYFEENV